ncbi:hypothetical protein BH18ACT15_BH18ACT15_02710 [soil metagenome]
MRRLGLLLVASLVALSVPAWGEGGKSSPSEAAAVQTADNFQLVGHSGLLGRGMNAAPAVYKDYVYVGSRTDASTGHEHAGVLVVGAADPANPRVVGEIGAPHEALPSQTSRELRVWPQKRLLIVMNFPCSTLIHSCVSGPETWDLSFYDLSGDNARHPRFIAKYEPPNEPHEMFLWRDPKRPNRALLYLSTPHNSESPDDATANLSVLDISHARSGIVEEIASFTANPRYSPSALKNFDVALHSMALSRNGKRTYLSYLGGGFLVLDSGELAQARPHPRFHLLTPVRNRPKWPNQTVHSAVKVPGRDLVVTTDEIYGDLLDDFAFEDHGCPWGWAHLIDISDEAHPRVVGQYRIKENHHSYCQTEEGQDPANTYFTSYASHNPTILKNLAFVTWHSGGFQAFRFADPTHPLQVGEFVPQPLRDVDTEDVALSQGLNKVVSWSYPIIKDGLIYMIDVRNGLYILRYTGPGASQVDRIHFYEGNSNLGRGLRLAP